MRGKQPEPRVFVLCRCGAQWWGRFAVDNPVIPIHEKRCGAPISEEAYALLTGRPLKRPRWWDK